MKRSNASNDLGASGEPRAGMDYRAFAFKTDLGWMAALGSSAADGKKALLAQLTFGHGTAAAALRALDAELLERAGLANWCPQWVKRLQAYARGARDDFRDLPIDLSAVSAFQKRVIERCRRIPFGQTQSYGALAASSGAPRGARAVGNVMAHNRCPLVVPCHRVVNADGGLGNYSGPSGTKMKARLLELEQIAASKSAAG